jgi:hypothetical protein
MTCPHPSLVQSTTYPVGTRCSQCGESAEGVLSSVRAKLDTMQVRVSVLEERETDAEQAKRELKIEREAHGCAIKLNNELGEELTETREQLIEVRKQLAQAETHLRNEQHYHKTTKDELRAALDRLELAERRPATVTAIKK